MKIATLATSTEKRRGTPCAPTEDAKRGVKKEVTVTV